MYTTDPLLATGPSPVCTPCVHTLTILRVLRKRAALFQYFHFLEVVVAG